MKPETKKNLKIVGGTAVVVGVLWWLLDDGMGLFGGKKDSGNSTASNARRLNMTIDARGCSVYGIDGLDCNRLCDDLYLHSQGIMNAFANIDSVTIDAKNGPHAWVENAIACLESQNLKVSVIRD